MQNVVYLHAEPTPIAQFLRVGTSGHRQLENFLAGGQLPSRRLVVGPSAFAKQKDLVAALQEGGRELILDTNVAELSCLGRYEGAGQDAPWANPEGVLSPFHFGRGPNEFDVVGKIARFAIENSVRRIHAPTHLLVGVSDPWFEVDRHSVEVLRQLLDQGGGKKIAIDYPLMIPNKVLTDSAERRAFVSALAALPIDSVWLRISGFGANATASGLRKYISAAQDFHQLGTPVVSDGVGGVAALAILSFGAASGVSHGVAEKERFDTSNWNLPRKQGGGGNGYCFLLPGIDRLLKKEQAGAIIAAPGARRLLSCNDRSCCPHGFEDTLKNPKGHYLRQRAFACEELSRIQDQVRPRHFLDQNLANTDRLARQIAKLKVGDVELSDMLVKNSARLDRARTVLEDLHSTGMVSSSPSFPPHAETKKTNRDGRQ
jgi:hypothetical protein